MFPRVCFSKSQVSRLEFARHSICEQVYHKEWKGRTILRIRKPAFVKIHLGDFVTSIVHSVSSDLVVCTRALKNFPVCIKMNSTTSHLFCNSANYGRIVNQGNIQAYFAEYGSLLDCVLGRSV